MKRILILLSCLCLLCGCGNKVSKVVCIGDSITYGYGLVNRIEDGWPYLLNEEDKYDVIEYGLSGSCAMRNSVFPYPQDVLEKALYEEADIYIFMLGTNDSMKAQWDATAFKKDYMSIIEPFKESGARIVIMAPIRVFAMGREVTDYSINPDCVEHEVRDIVKDISKEMDLEYIDLFPVIKKDSLTLDGIHPNEKGNQLIYKTIKKKL